MGVYTSDHVYLIIVVVVPLLLIFKLTFDIFTKVNGKLTNKYIQFQ